MTSKPMDGYYGERTALSAFLFDKSRQFHRGLEAGRTVHRTKLARNLERIQANYLGGDYLLGFKFGKDVRKHGIKKAIRKARA